MKVHLICILLLPVLACHGPVAREGELDARIGPPIAEKYQSIQDGQDWLNPFLQVCPQGVILSVKRGTQTLRIEDLRQNIRELSVESWPYGRIVALQSCSIGILSYDEMQRQRMSKVQGVLRTLRLGISLWPS
ncbi:MAG TPA: hypothetical protein VFR18_00200 [Terriglobia bacterium]|nr:hypothetical protein [Terriglobia bacterium]